MRVPLRLELLSTNILTIAFAGVLGVACGSDDAPDGSFAESGAVHGGASDGTPTGSRDALSSTREGAPPAVAPSPMPVDAPAVPALPAGPARRGALNGLPSVAGSTVAQIAALGDNAWLDLGSPAPDPVWGKATGRSWGAKMPYAPDLRGAFLLGEGPHAYIKPNGHQDDDLWFYDVNAHRWVCIHPGTDTQTFTDNVKAGTFGVDADHQLVDDTRQPIPVHTLLHAWGNVTYNADEGKLVWFARWSCGYYFLAHGLEDGCQQAIAQGLNGAPGSPWFYDTVLGKFEHSSITTLPPGADDDGAANQFVYVRSKRKYFSFGRRGSGMYDPVTKGWTDLPGVILDGIDFAATYDEKRDRIYIGGGGYTANATTPGDNFYVYDVQAGTLTRPYPTGDFPMFFSSNYAFFNYDVVNDLAVIVSADQKSVFAYDPTTNSWSSPPTTGPVGGYPFGNGFYAAEFNAYFFHFAGDGLDNGSIWAYRYKK